MVFAQTNPLHQFNFELTLLWFVLDFEKMENLKVEVTTSKRGGLMLFENGFKFNAKEKLANGELKWRCPISRCTAAIYTIGDEHLVSRHNLDHCHEKLSVAVKQKALLSAAAKRKASEDIALPPKKILQAVLKETDCSELDMNAVGNVKKSVYRERRKKFPTLPKSSGETQGILNTIKDNIITSRQENFLVLNDTRSQIVIFSCPTNLQQLCKSKCIFMDGTFKYCPKYFLQVFTIHGHFNGHNIPLAFCLLKDKLTVTYKNCLSSIVAKCAEMNLIFSPEEVVIDFEMAIHKAVNAVWSGTKITGCRFHLSQAWWRKIQHLGLSKDYKERTEVGKWIGYCFGLMFLGKLIRYFYHNFLIIIASVLHFVCRSCICRRLFSFRPHS